ncbi:hypothetical protein ACSBR2_030450 [Camellia fascicularis]
MPLWFFQMFIALIYRQFHNSFFDKSDLFFLCMLHPLSFNIQKQEFEIEATQSTKRHLTKTLENLDWKLDKQKETSKLIANDMGNIFFLVQVLMHDFL